MLCSACAFKNMLGDKRKCQQPHDKPDQVHIHPLKRCKAHGQSEQGARDHRGHHLPPPAVAVLPDNDDIDPDQDRHQDGDGELRLNEKAQRRYGDNAQSAAETALRQARQKNRGCRYQIEGKWKGQNEADKQTNQKTAAYRPSGWGSTLLKALSECVQAIHRFPYEGDAASDDS